MIRYIVLDLSRSRSHSHYLSVSLFPSIPFEVCLFLSPLSLPISVASSLTLSLSSISSYLCLTKKNTSCYVYKYTCMSIYAYIFINLYFYMNVCIYIDIMILSLALSRFVFVSHSRFYVYLPMSLTRKLPISLQTTSLFHFTGHIYQ